MVKFNKKVINVIIYNDFCLQSSTCQHYCTIHYDDNSKEDVRLSSVDIYAKYRKYIDESNLNHYKEDYIAQQIFNERIKEYYKPINRIKRFIRYCCY